ncbi:MAG: phosphoribosylaminoimidazolesuccinocarboxamide synthase [Saprospiraceae bacterium]|nr:phosphoribosylaminoimidazolesuccinocarboxamide synthase [Saprospiraceae bacterium]
MASSSPESVSLTRSNLDLPGQKDVYHGKVRDVYVLDRYLVMVVSDRISAFDHILPRPIPYKGQVLNGIASHFLESTSDIVPNWLISTPHANVAIGKKCDPIPLEMVIRGYLTGHAWRTYKSGKRELCGVEIPDGMKEHDPFPEPIITPATKAENGHDEDISKEEILEKEIVDENTWNKLSEYTRKLFDRGTEMARSRGLILVDTKYEFGFYNDEILLMDEIHTPDSSRYFYLEGYEERQEKDEGQTQLSKEFVREWLMDHGFQGREEDILPEMPTEFVWQVSERYRELYEKVIGQQFVAYEDENLEESIEKAIIEELEDGISDTDCD